MKRTLVIALIVVCMMFGVVAYATAAAPTATGTVTVSVKPNPKVDLTVGPNIVDFAVDPGIPTDLTPVSISVKSNAAWSLGRSVTSVTNMNLTAPVVIPVAGGAGVTNFTDTYRVNVDYAAPAGVTLGGASVSYTLTQP